MKASFKPRQLSVPNSEAIEQLWVAISFQTNTLFICVLDIPPDRSHDMNVIDQHVSAVNWITDKMKIKDSLLILGDFNIPGIRWKCSTSNYLYPDVISSSIRSSDATLIDSLNMARVSQLNYVVNHNNRILDLCFGSIDGDVRLSLIETPSCLVKPTTHHPSLLIEVIGATPCVFVEPVKSLYNDFKHGDYSGMNTFSPILTGWMLLIRISNYQSQHSPT